MSEKDVLKKQDEETTVKEKEKRGIYVLPPEDEDYWLRCEEGNKVDSIFDKWK